MLLKHITGIPLTLWPVLLDHYSGWMPYSVKYFFEVTNSIRILFIDHHTVSCFV